MSSYIPAELRRFVQARAGDICEYCLMHQQDTYLGCQVDHIISEKHGGATIEGNLAYACVFCNRFKGTDIGSISHDGKQFVAFFNPRKDTWFEHFRLDDATIEALTITGDVTARILGFNTVERQLERMELIQAGKYPSPSALQLMLRTSN
jgi:hypothetical protein